MVELGDVVGGKIRMSERTQLLTYVIEKGRIRGDFIRVGLGEVDHAQIVESNEGVTLEYAGLC